jgi:hypothetical protein
MRTFDRRCVAATQLLPEHIEKIMLEMMLDY